MKTGATSVANSAKTGVSNLTTNVTNSAKTGLNNAGNSLKKTGDKMMKSTGLRERTSAEKGQIARAKNKALRIKADAATRKSIAHDEWRAAGGRTKGEKIKAFGSELKSSIKTGVSNTGKSIKDGTTTALQGAAVGAAVNGARGESMTKGALGGAVVAGTVKTGYRSLTKA